MSMIPRPDLARSVQAGAMLGEAIGGAIDAKQESDFQKDLQDTLARPNFRSFNDLMTKYPSKAENIQKLNDRMDAAEKESSYKTGIDVYTALETGNTDTAKTILDEQIAAGKNAGRDMRIIENIRTKMDQDPKAAQAGIGLWLAGSDPKRWDETTTAFEARAKKEAERQKAEFQSVESRAKAQKAAVDSKFAESNALLDLQKKGYDITKIQQDISFAKENQRIAMLDKQLKREEDALRRKELEGKLVDAQAARDEKVKQKAADAEGAVATIDNSLTTIQRVLNNPAWRDVVGSFEGGEWIGEPLTLFDDKEQDAIAAIETLGSQVFLTNAKQFGSTAGLTEKEGAKLQASLASLTRKQSEESFQKNLEEADRLMRKARSNLFRRSGMPETRPDIPQEFTGAQAQPGRGTIQPAGAPLPGEFSAPGVVPTGGGTQMPAGFRRLPSTQ